jgi:hypothetical protein
MRFAIGLALLLGCGSEPGADQVVISGSGSGPCENLDPAQGPVWHFESQSTSPHISTIDISLNNLIAGDAGLYVSGLRLLGGIQSFGPPITANLVPDDGVVVSITATFSKIPAPPTGVACQWDAIGPYWPDAPQ